MLNLVESIRGTASASDVSRFVHLYDGTKVSSKQSNHTTYYLGSLISTHQDGGIPCIESIAFSGGLIVGSQSFPTPVYHTRYYLRDHLGSVRSIVDGTTGQVLERNDYTAYGLRWDVAGYPRTNNRYLFNGKEEVKGGYLDYGFRLYDPRNARWTTVDPLADSYVSTNPYVYCGGDPVNRIDPDGRDWFMNIETGKMMWNRSESPFFKDHFGNGWLNMGETYLEMDEDGTAIYYTQITGKRGETRPLTHRFSENEMAVFGMYHSEDAMMAAMKYHLNPSAQNAWNMVWTEIRAQWRDPYLLVGSATIGITAISSMPRASITRKSVGPITGYTKHGLMQSISRNNKGVHPSAIVDAVREPIQIIPQTNGVKYVGKYATVVLNNNGKIITAWGKAPRSPSNK